MKNDANTTFWNVNSLFPHYRGKRGRVKHMFTDSFRSKTASTVHTKSYRRKQVAS
jgi:hypothetical protein